MEGALTGQLVVATATLADPNFAATVVLVLEHEPSGGALGVVLNRPSSVTVAQTVPGWEAGACAPPVVFIGGPVAPDSLIAVAHRGGEPPLAWQAIADPVGVVDLGAEAAVVLSDVVALRVFAGYAGWGAGQLEAEIAEGAWFVVPTDTGDAFSADPGELWRAVLVRQGGLFTTAARNPSLN